LPLFEFLGPLDDPREIGGLLATAFGIDEGVSGWGVGVDVGVLVVVVVIVVAVVGVSGFLVDKGRLRNKTAGSMASSEQ
jgi:hypothetical protein